MSKQFFNTIMRGMEEARAYMEGARDGYRVTVSPSMNAKNWAKIREALPPETQARMDDRLKEVLGTELLDNVRQGS
jgi:hypothetical protein